MKASIRLFLGFLVLILTGLLISESVYAEWFKGNLHMHTQWSDGEPMPEWAVAWYKENGYHFIVTTDHNTFQSNELRFKAWSYHCETSDLTLFEQENSRWKEVRGAGWNQLTQKSIDETAAKFGEDSLKCIKDGDRVFYRLKTFDELVEQFAEPGRFLIIPGFEQTGGSGNGHQVHMNFINVRSAFPYLQRETPKQTIQDNLNFGRQCYEYNLQPWLFILNHPIWRYYDVSPSDLIQLPEIQFFELNNNGTTYPVHEKGWDPEKFWDAVNAFRLVEGKQILLGIGSDDRHSYDSFEGGWTVVNADNLTTPAIIDALTGADFYASNGLDFETIQFDDASKTLSVKVKAEEGKAYRIDFIGTKKSFDQTVEIIDLPAEPPKPERKLEVYSDEIGIVLKSVDGTEAEYQMQDDDLYVRARVILSTEENKGLLPEPAAWTQPHH